MKTHVSDKPLYDGKYPQDSFLQHIAHTRKLSLQDRIILENDAYDERYADLYTAIRDPRVQLRSLHFCRNMAENGSENNKKFSTAIRREDLQNIVRSIEQKFTDYLIALQNIPKSETTQQCLDHWEQMAGLINQLPFRPSTLRKWFLSAPNNIPKAPQEIFETAMSHVCEVPIGKGSRLFASFQEKTHEISQMLTLLSSDQQESPKDVFITSIATLSYRLVGLRSAYKKMRDRSEENAITSQGIRQLRSILELLEHQVIHHSHAFLTQEKFQKRNEGEMVTEARYMTRELIESHLGMVVKIAKEFTGQGVDFLDLVQQGSLKLSSAAQAHDPSRGRFTTYIYPVLRKEIRGHIRNNTLIKMPHQFQLQLATVRREMKRYVEIDKQYTKAGNEDCVTWLMQETGMSQSIIHQCLFWLDKNWQKPMSLDLYIRDTHEQRAAYKEDDPEDIMSQLSAGHEWMSLGDTITYPDESKEQIRSQVQQIMLREKIAQVLKTLTYQERIAITMQYGLGSEKSCTLTEVSEILQVTTQRVRQIVAKGVRKLQNSYRSDQLKPFLD